MREIKFQYICKDACGEFFTFTKSLSELEEGALNIHTCGRIQEILSRRQYTGLKDCKGNEIYEGDIVSWTGYRLGGKSITGKPYERYNSVVKFVESTWHYRGKKNSLFHIDIYEDTEVIGNIYENKDLLEDE